jgi:hypothetical protein
MAKTITVEGSVQWKDRPFKMRLKSMRHLKKFIADLDYSGGNYSVHVRIDNVE